MGDEIRLNSDEGVVTVQTPGCTGEVRLQGATVTAWRPAGEEPVIFLNDRAVFAAHQEVYGGIPVVAPWFGPGRREDKPYLHGYAQFQTWRFDGYEAVAAGSRLRFSWHNKHRFEYTVTMGRTFTCSLTLTAGSEPFDVEQALHTYLAVGDVRDVEVIGLEGAEYLDKTQDYARRRQSGAVRFGSETDRVYLVPTDVEVHDPTGGRRLRVAGRGGANTVVWNPGEAKAAELSPFAPEQWCRFVCVETANVLDSSFVLGPGESRTLEQTVEVAGPYPVADPDDAGGER